jgi:GT2 family glycosyltransferase
VSEQVCDPTISVVVLALAGGDQLDTCLRGLAAQDLRGQAQIVLVGRDATIARNVDPSTEFVLAPSDADIPLMRVLGSARAKGEYVVFTEDRCVASPHWLEQILREHERGTDIVGGPIEPGEIRGRTGWAVYLCEYAALMLPVNRGTLPGNNVSMRRSMLERVDVDFRASAWEADIVARLSQEGARATVSPEAVLYKTITMTLGTALAQRYHFSRTLAAARARRMPKLERFTRTLAAPMLPALILLRIATSVFKKKRYRGRFLSSLPHLLLLMIAYTAGEVAGYVAGSGTSPTRVA